MYEKRLCVLRQIKKGFSADGKELSGIVYAERLGEKLVFTPRLTDFAPVREGRYVLAVRVGEERFFFAMKGNGPLTAPSAPPLSGGFSALVCFVRGEAEPVAFGSCDGSKSYSDLLARAVSKEEKRQAPLPSPLPPNELPVPLSPQVPRAPGVPLPEEDEPPFRDEASYDDEAIAAANYFEEQDHADELAPRGGTGEAKTDESGQDVCENDGHAVHPLLRGGGLTYYNEMKEKLGEAFRKFPRDTRLLSVFPASEWVNADGSLLGIVYENGLPRYLCVGVEKHGDPPEAMRGQCVFVPASYFTEEEGFYLVFQDAGTGEVVTVGKS